MPIVRLPGGSLRDEIREPLFDTLDINNGDTIEGTREFFTSVQGKSTVLTNLTQNSQLPTAVSFRVQGLAIDVQNFRLANFLCVPLILEHSGIQLKVGEKTYWNGPMRFVGGRIRSDVAGTMSDTAVATSGLVYQQHGDASVATVALRGKHVVDINPLQNFSVSWLIAGMTAGEIAEAEPAADTKLRYVCSLKGLKRRPVQ